MKTLELLELLETVSPRVDERDMAKAKEALRLLEEVCLGLRDSQMWALYGKTEAVRIWLEEFCHDGLCSIGKSSVDRELQA